MRGKVLAAVVGAVLSATFSSAENPCARGPFDVHGIVTDPAGQPIPRARIYLLLDQISEKKSVEQGFRAVPVRAGQDGRFSAFVDCPAYRARRKTGEPNPCAPKPKHVTVFLGEEGFAVRARVFRLKELTTIVTRDRCSVALPELRLRPEE
jgi:hypothetical protein